MRKRGFLLLTLILLAVAALLVSLWVNQGPLWRWVVLETHVHHSPRDGNAIRWVTTRSRWSKGKVGCAFRHSVGYYVQTGTKAGELRYDGDENLVLSTRWNFDGSIESQHRNMSLGQVSAGNYIWSGGERQREPPWWNGVTEQTEPSMPEWMKADDQWQAALDAQK